MPICCRRRSRSSTTCRCRTPPPIRLARFVSAGGGLLVAAGPHASWPSKGADSCPRFPASGARSHDGHAVAPRRAGVRPSGVRSVPRAAKRRFLGGALLWLPGCGPRAGAGARPIRRRIAGVDGAAIRARDGRLLWMSTLDLGWNDLPVKPVFLPFVHTMMRYLADYAEAPTSLTVGQVVPAARRSGPGRAAPHEAPRSRWPRPARA